MEFLFFQDESVLLLIPKKRDNFVSVNILSANFTRFKIIFAFCKLIVCIFAFCKLYLWYYCKLYLCINVTNIIRKSFGITLVDVYYDAFKL